MKKFNKEKGGLAEKIACQYLQKNGFKVIARNYFSGRFGEIDIVATKGDVMCFFEVKAKFNKEFGLPEEMISRGKLRKIKRASEIFLYKNPGYSKQNYMFRLDVIAIELDSRHEVQSLRHYENLDLEMS